MRARALAIVVALCALGALCASVTATARPAAADTFGGWTYDVQVDAARFDGLALENVTWNGMKIFERISLPVMTVFYENDACGPFVDRPGGATYTGPFGQDFTQDGVRWRSIGLTDQIANYTITMIYYLSENGDFDAHIFAKGLQCNNFHEHYPFWRLDFDLAGPANDEIRYDNGNGFTTLTREFSLPATTAVAHRWEVRDRVTGDRVTIAFDNGTFTIPGSVLPVQSYENNRVYGRQFRFEEETWRSGATRSALEGDNGETMVDAVLWYSGYMPHRADEGQDTWHSTGIRMQINPQNARATVGGRLTDGATGAGVSGVSVDLFTRNADGSRGQYRSTVTTGADGSYRFVVPAGCYTVVAIAPTGRTFVDGSRWAQQSTCLSGGQTTTSLNATLAAAGSGAGLGGRIGSSDGRAVSGVTVDLFSANGDGTRSQYLRSTTTAADGTYRLDVAAGCYVVVAIAPTGATFVDGSRFNQQARCLGQGQVVTNLTATVATGSPGTVPGRVTTTAGFGVGGVVADLFVANADGSRGTFLGNTATAADGTFRFSRPAGCYVVVMIAPAGRTFVGGGLFAQRSVCVTAGGTAATVTATLN